MDELNQIQNPNMSMPSQPSGPASMPGVSSSEPAKKGINPLFLLIVAGAVLVAGIAWWYISQMAGEPMVQQQATVNQEARQDMLINKDIQAIDSTNLDSEFKTIDNDINSL